MLQNMIFPNSSEELFDIIDTNGKPTGKTVPRRIAHEKGIRHSTSHVWVLNQKDQKPYVLLQKRAFNKDSFPGTYDTSCAGHIVAGDSPKLTALRELEEELGIQAPIQDLQFMGNFEIHTDTIFHNKPFKDNEFDYGYLYTNQVTHITIQPEELESAEWFYLLDVMDALQLKDPNYVIPIPGFCTLLRYLEQHPNLISENLYRQQVILAAIRIFLNNYQNLSN